MKRNKLYIILSIITILSLFITGATCSFCGMQLGTALSDETKIDVKEDTAEEAESENTDKETAEDKDITHSSQTDSDNKAPTISLSISEGPTYSEADDVCWYRIKATVTGSPAPKITWSKDYSNGSFGNTIAQVNLTRDEPGYTLNATATNSEGSATDTIELFWGCDENGSDDTAEPEEKLITLYGDKNRSGHILELHGPGGPNPVVGDNESKQIFKGFLSFDISELEEFSVLDAQLNLPIDSIKGNPDTISHSLNIKACDYGERFDYNAFEVSGINVYTFDISGVAEHDVLSINENNNLINTLQDAIDNGRNWYQLKLVLAAANNDDSIQDTISFDINGCTLIINYSK